MAEKEKQSTDSSDSKSETPAPASLAARIAAFEKVVGMDIDKWFKQVHDHLFGGPTA